MSHAPALPLPFPALARALSFLRRGRLLVAATAAVIAPGPATITPRAAAATL